jgi:hypothetical protein
MPFLAEALRAALRSDNWTSLRIGAPLKAKKYWHANRPGSRSRYPSRRISVQMRVVLIDDRHDFCIRFIQLRVSHDRLSQMSARLSGPANVRVPKSRPYSALLAVHEGLLNGNNENQVGRLAIDRKTGLQRGVTHNSARRHFAALPQCTAANCLINGTYAHMQRS